MIFAKPVVVLDIETNLITTRKPFPEPLEIAAIKLDSTLDEIDRFHCYVKQDVIDYLSLELTGLEKEQIVTGLDEFESIQKITKFCSNCYISSFNLTFDLGVLKCAAARHNYETYLGRSILDIKSLCHFYIENWGMKIKSSSLGGFYKRFFEEEIKKSHRAMIDTEMAVKILKYISENVDEKTEPKT